MAGLRGDPQARFLFVFVYTAQTMSKGSPKTVRDSILTLERNAGVATVAINRPDASNAIDNALRNELSNVFDSLAADRQVRAVILTSSGDDSFSVGMDVAELAAMSPREIEQVGLQARGVYERMIALEVPIIAAVKGACLGAESYPCNER